MATSSIFSNIHIQTQQQAELFANALEESEKKLKTENKKTQDLVLNFPTENQLKDILKKRFSVK